MDQGHEFGPLRHCVIRSGSENSEYEIPTSPLARARSLCMCAFFPAAKICGGIVASLTCLGLAADPLRFPRSRPAGRFAGSRVGGQSLAGCQSAGRSVCSLEFAVWILSEKVPLMRCRRHLRKVGTLRHSKACDSRNFSRNSSRHFQSAVATVNENVHPPPGVSVTDRVLPCASTIRLQKSKPRPNEESPVGVSPSPCRCFVKTLGFSSSEIPGPLSITRKRQAPGCSSAVRRILLCGGQNLTAFEIRFISTL